MKINLSWLVLVVALVVAVGVGVFLYGNKKTENSSQEQVSQNQLVNIQEDASQKALEEAAKAANPFQNSNPLEGVKTNPFEDVRKKLNPFE